MYCNKCCQSMTLEEQIIYICDNEYEYFFKKANVIGIGLGYKVVKGIEITDKKCIKVLVSKKIEDAELPQEDLIPLIYNGIETDVIETGVIGTDAMEIGIEKKDQTITIPTTPVQGRIRPVLGGYDIGPAIKNLKGTMGCLVTDGQKNYLLSNNHVLALLGNLPIGFKIVQPVQVESTITDTDVIANLSKYIPIKYPKDTGRKANYVDAAIAELLDNNIASSQISLTEGPKGIAPHKLGELVKKVGTSSGLTTGIIKIVNATLLIPGKKQQMAIFKKQIVTSTMALSEDSGAILLNDNDYALGLLMCCNENITVYNSIYRVLSELNVNIIIK